LAASYRLATGDLAVKKTVSKRYNVSQNSLVILDALISGK
jgi:hypothetical protein